jgi:two-component sensor histidine kinase
LKYAFPQDKKGEIRIALGFVNDEMYELIVSDNGIGMPGDLDFFNTKSFGLHLVKMLAEGQLEGKVELNRTEGTEYHIHFKKPVFSM